MASLYQLKARFQNLLRPAVRRLAASGITPNQITVAAAVLSCAAGAAIALRPDPQLLILLPAVLAVRMALNAIDGMLAREHGMQTRLGAVLNELGDAISDTALYLPLALVPGFSAVLVVGLVVLALLAEMSGIIAVQIGAGRRYDGPMGKSDRALVLGTVGLLPGLGLAPGAWLSMVLVLVNLLLIATIHNRIRQALREVSNGT